MIELKEHNKRPYEELCRMLEKHDKCAYVSATGTGKSYVIGKYIEEHDLVDKTLMLVPSNAIKKSWQKLLPGLEIISYQWLLRRKPVLDSYALIVCDEMHHLGAEKWGSFFLNTITEFCGKVIGTTATPIRYLDMCRDMTREMFKGNIVKGLELPEAINQGILPSFEYITALYDLPKRMEKYADTQITEKLSNRLEFMQNEYSFKTILKNNLTEKNSKTAVFVNSISDIDEVKALIEDVFPGAKQFVAHSDLRKSEIDNALQSFESEIGNSFIYTVDLFNEGVHIDGVNSVVMFRRTKSPAVYLQQIGRALSANMANERVKIIDFVANHANLKSYVGNRDSTVQWIQSQITNPQRQIIVCDYALEELELLSRISSILKCVWTEEEDNILRENYEKGVDAVLSLLPNRTKDGVHSRAKTIGVAKKMREYSEQFYTDLKNLYPLQPDGRNLMLEKYPFLTRTGLTRLARINNVRSRVENHVWTDEDDDILRANIDLSNSELMKLLPGKTSSSLTYRKKKLGISVQTCLSEEQLKVILEHPDWHPKRFIEVYNWKFGYYAIEQNRIKLGLAPMLMPKKSWSEEEIKILESNLNCDLTELCELLPRHSMDAIRRRRNLIKRKSIHD